MSPIEGEGQNIDPTFGPGLWAPIYYYFLAKKCPKAELNELFNLRKDDFVTKRMCSLCDNVKIGYQLQIVSFCHYEQ